MKLFTKKIETQKIENGLQNYIKMQHTLFIYELNKLKTHKKAVIQPCTTACGLCLWAI